MAIDALRSIPTTSAPAPQARDPGRLRTRRCCVADSGSRAFSLAGDLVSEAFSGLRPG
jgi:hypothetical protein